MNVSGKVSHMLLAIIKDFGESAGDWARRTTCILFNRG